MLDEQARQIAYLVTEAQKRQARVFEVTAEAEEAWVDEIVRKSALREKFLEECTPGYYNNEGKQGAIARQNTSYGAGPNAYFAVLEGWRKGGEMEGLALQA